MRTSEDESEDTCADASDIDNTTATSYNKDDTSKRNGNDTCQDHTRIIVETLPIMLIIAPRRIPFGIIYNCCWLHCNSCSIYMDAS